jgi:hypothetical protein
MTDPILTEEARMLAPVQANDTELPKELWTTRLVVFLRVMAVLSLIKGLYHWAIVIGLHAPDGEPFEVHYTPFQAATVFYAVIDLVAAVGLWLAAPWGAVVWLTSVISMAAIEALFPVIFGGSLWVVAVELALLGLYLGLALQAAREQPL